MDPQTKAKYTRLANLKTQIKVLKEESEKIQSALVYNTIEPPEKKVVTKYGSLQLYKRDTYEDVRNADAITVVGKDTFLKEARMTKTQIGAVAGKLGLEKLDKLGGLVIKSSTKYYQLKSIK